ncbi:MAG: hypothetical protein M5U08_02970 [Burkholderiales bacterium]|nr:hypothetical protein [Burkholderiales bacterium]
MQPAAEGDRQHENVDREHVEREEPDRLVQVAFVHVLDHRHLELARQEHDREHRQDRQPHPASVAAGDALDRREHRRQPRLGGGAREDVAESVVDDEGDEDADRHECEQFHQRLEGDRRDHALVMLGGVEMARSEQNGEERERRGHPERGVGQDRHRADGRRHHDVRVLQQDHEAVRHRLQLQRDVGHDADHRDDGDQPADQRALAVARGDEVGERGDAVLLGDAQDLAHHHPPQRDHQRGAEVDRQEADAVGRRAPDAAVEGPGGGVDREREAVDVGARDDRAAAVGALVGVVGDAEQQPQVGDRGEDDHPALEHGGPRPLGARRPDADRAHLPLPRSTTSAIAAIRSAQAAKM